MAENTSTGTSTALTHDIPEITDTTVYVAEVVAAPEAPSNGAAIPEIPCYDGDSPLAQFVSRSRERIADWDAKGQRFADFAAAKGPAVVAAYEAFFVDLALHLDALAEPARLTGRADYSAADLLVDLRHLRDLNKALVRTTRPGLVRRYANPRAKMRWATELTEGPAGTAAQTTANWYAVKTDELAYQLAKALKPVKR